MSDSEQITIYPLDASTDGTRNMYSRRCEAIGQTMNYAACLWRQKVLEKPDVRTPSDWSPCADAARCGKCNAIEMRQEELLKGHSIYFKDRNTVHKAIRSGREWIMPVYNAVVSASTSVIASFTKPIAVSKPAVVARPRATSVIDAMADSGGYADAINALSSTPSTPSTPSSPIASSSPSVSSTHIQPKSAVLPGESPLALARRMAAERKSATT